MIYGIYVIRPGNRKSAGAGEKRGLFICLLNITNISTDLRSRAMAVRVKIWETYFFILSIRYLTNKPQMNKDHTLMDMALWCFELDVILFFPANASFPITGIASSHLFPGDCHMTSHVTVKSPAACETCIEYLPVL